MRSRALTCAVLCLPSQIKRDAMLPMSADAIFLPKRVLQHPKTAARYGNTMHMLYFWECDLKLLAPMAGSRLWGCNPVATPSVAYIYFLLPAWSTLISWSGTIVPEDRRGLPAPTSAYASKEPKLTSWFMLEYRFSPGTRIRIHRREKMFSLRIELRAFRVHPCEANVITITPRKPNDTCVRMFSCEVRQSQIDPLHRIIYRADTPNDSTHKLPMKDI